MLDIIGNCPEFSGDKVGRDEVITKMKMNTENKSCLMIVWIMMMQNKMTRLVIRKAVKINILKNINLVRQEINVLS